MSFLLEIRPKNHVDASRGTGLRRAWDNYGFNVYKPFFVPENPALLVRLLSLQTTCLKVLYRISKFSSSWRNPQWGGRIASTPDLLFCFRNPIVEGIRLIQTGTILLDAATPNVLIWIDVQCPAPMLDRLSEIALPSEIRVITFSVCYSKAKVGRTVTRLLLKRILVSSDGLTDFFSITPEKDGISKSAQRRRIPLTSAFLQLGSVEGLSSKATDSTGGSKLVFKNRCKSS